MKSVSNSMFTTPKRQFDFSFSRAWLYANKTLSNTEVNTGKIRLELAATEVTRTLKWTGLRLPVKMVKPSSPAKVVLKKSQGQKQQRNNTWALPNSVTVSLLLQSQSLVVFFFLLKSLTAYLTSFSKSRWWQKYSFNVSICVSCPLSLIMAFWEFQGSDALALEIARHVVTLGSVQTRKLSCFVLESLFFGRGLSPKSWQAATRYFLDMML